MKLAERKSIIINALKKQNTLSFAELEQLLDVSTTTIRRDLLLLEKEGFIVRFHGGIKSKESLIDHAMSKKRRINIDEKKRIGRLARSLIKPDSLIFIGSGSSTYYMINYIKDTSITVITNGIPHAEALNTKNIRTFLLCGFIKGETRSVAGDETTEMIGSYQFDQAFLGSNGVSSDLELLSADKFEHDIKEASIKHSREAYFLTDSSKFNKTAMYALPLKQDNMFILTESAPEVDHERVIVAR